MIAVRVGIKQDSVLAALGRLSLEGNDKVDLLDEIGISVAEDTRLRFTDGVDPEGEPWIPSLRATLQGGETLRDTGRLMNSITHVTSANAVEVGTNVPYALPLHFGVTIHAVNGPYLRFKVPGGGWARKSEVTIPARPFLGINDEDAARIADVIQHFLDVKYK